MIYSTGTDNREGFISRRKSSSTYERKRSNDMRKTEEELGAKAFSTATIGVATEHLPDTSSTLKQLRPRDVLEEYSQEALVHGVHYFMRKELYLIERLSWIIAVAICALFAVIFVHVSWVKFMTSPIVTNVETTYFPLHELPFPAVTICSSNNIRRAEAERILLRHLKVRGEPNATLSLQLWNVMNALSKLQFPFYQAMHEHLVSAGELLPRLADLNISTFMLQVMPTCFELFDACFWQGSPIDCCQEFHVQRYEGGFCYAFNSLTSNDMQNCDTSIYPEETSSNNSADCFLRHNTACGTATGLEVYIKRVENEEQLLRQSENTGVRVLVHSPDTFPEEGHSFFVAEHPTYSTGGVLKVSPSLTESSQQLRSMNPNFRQCYFPDEHKLLISKDYTHDNCLIQCRLMYIARKCGCVPYSLAALVDVPECNITRLDCIIQHTPNLRFFSPPHGARGFRKEEGQLSSGLNCSHCLPACHDSKYDMEAFTTTNFKFTVTNKTYLDVFYKEFGAVKYNRDVAFGQIDLLVSLGGIVSLFLGVSLLSGVELLYYIAKLVTVFSCGLRRRSVAPITTSISPCHQPPLILPCKQKQQETTKSKYITLEKLKRTVKNTELLKN